MDASEYAKRRGVSKPMVTKYLQAGMIQSARRVGRSWEIDAEKADQELDAVLDQSRGGKREPRPRPEPGPALEPPSREPAPAEALDVSGPPPRAVPSLAQNRNIREFYSARIAKLEYEQRLGKLVPKDELRLKLAKLHLAVRDNLRTIPDRIAPVLAAETDQAKIHAMLLKEIGRALEGLQGFDWH